MGGTFATQTCVKLMKLVSLSVNPMKRVSHVIVTSDNEVVTKHQGCMLWHRIGLIGEAKNCACSGIGILGPSFICRRLLSLLLPHLLELHCSYCFHIYWNCIVLIVAFLCSTVNKWSQCDPNPIPRSNMKSDTRSDPRSDLRSYPRFDLRYDPGSDLRSNPRSNPRSYPRSNPKSDPRSDPRSDHVQWSIRLLHSLPLVLFTCISWATLSR